LGKFIDGHYFGHFLTFFIIDAVAKGDDDGIMVEIYDTVQDELRAMKKRYENEKEKVLLSDCMLCIFNMPHCKKCILLITGITNC